MKPIAYYILDNLSEPHSTVSNTSLFGLSWPGQTRVASRYSLYIKSVSFEFVIVLIIKLN